MIEARTIKRHYNFSDRDARVLAGLAPLMQEAADVAAERFHAFVNSFEETARFIADEEKARRHRLTIRNWFLDLFSGTYDNQYFSRLERIGKIHVRIGLDGHFVNAAMNVVREVVDSTLLGGGIAAAAQRAEALSAVEKILDMNLDVMTTSYREEELQKVFLTQRLDTALIRFAERFTYGLNMILVVSLMAISVLVVGLFGFDVRNLITGKAEKGILGALGTLLIIWVMIELMENEIRQLKGGRFRIQIFLGVALVAFLREVLISSLAHNSITQQFFLIGAILAIGIVYWLISRSEHPAA